MGGQRSAIAQIPSPTRCTTERRKLIPLPGGPRAGADSAEHKRGGDSVSPSSRGGWRRDAPPRSVRGSERWDPAARQRAARRTFSFPLSVSFCSFCFFEPFGSG